MVVIGGYKYSMLIGSFGGQASRSCMVVQISYYLRSITRGTSRDFRGIISGTPIDSHPIIRRILYLVRRDLRGIIRGGLTKKISVNTFDSNLFPTSR